jgi:hypothetical protein
MINRAIQIAILALVRIEISILWMRTKFSDDALPISSAEAIKEKIGAFLKDGLKLKLSEAKTLVTHARTGAARFLGYEVTVIHDDNLMDHSKLWHTKGCSTHKRRRCNLRGSQRLFFNQLLLRLLSQA